MGFSNRVERLDAHATEGTIGEAVRRLQEGESLALVTDAGTPGISDPAARLVAAARAAAVAVVPIPGPSAVTALLSVSGFAETAFVFRGFFPREKKDRKTELAQAVAASDAGLARVFVWFESPMRVVDALETIAAVCPDTEMVVAKELTKIYERVFSGASQDLSEIVKKEVEREGAVGEWCFALRFAEKTASEKEPVETSNWYKALQLLIECGVPRSDAAKKVSQSFGVQRNEVYEVALKIISGKDEK